MKLPAVPLVAVPETEEAKAASGFKWAGSDIGHRHRIGGEPQWLQGEDVPICTCGKPMDFYAQLDSIGDQFCIADCGLIYVFLCWDCFETKSIIQSY